MSTVFRSSIALFTVGALVAGAVWLEHHYPALWSDRLWLPAWRNEPARHTPRHLTGTELPSTITQATTFTPADNPILLRRTTEIPAGVTVTFTPGTQLYADEFAQLHVAGHLAALGTEAQPVIFTSNELHPDNQLWGGVLVQANGTASLTRVIIEHAAPGLGCLDGSRATGEAITIRQSPLGVYTETAACVLQASLITAVRTGLVTIGEPPTWTTTTVRAQVRERLSVPAR